MRSPLCGQPGCVQRPRPVAGLARRCAVILLALLPAAPAGAVVVGTYPKKPVKLQVHGRAVVIGTTMMRSSKDSRYHDDLLGSGSQTITGGTIPPDATVKGAWLTWSGSAHSYANPAADSSVGFAFPGKPPASLQADACVTRKVPNLQNGSAHFYCRRDLSALLAQHAAAGGSLNGTYTLSGLDAQRAVLHVATPQSPCPYKLPNGTDEAVCCGRYKVPTTETEPDPSTPCQAFHASWSLVLVYDTDFSDTVLRDVYLYDGFVLIDEQLHSTGQVQLGLQGFSVGNPVQARLSYYAVEGDRHLGIPAQSPASAPVYAPACNTCYDFVQVTGSRKTGKLTGADNPDPDNIFNSTPADGIDLDTFDISPYLKTGDTSLSVLISSGDGKLSDNGSQASPCPLSPSLECATSGFGELVGYGWTMIEISRRAPNFRKASKYLVQNKESHSAHPGDTLSYTLRLRNDGPVDAVGTVVHLDKWLPAGLSYVPGSTLLDSGAGGMPLADVAGDSPLKNGYPLGTVKAGGQQEFAFTFRVRVDDPATVSRIRSTASIDFTYNGTDKGRWKSRLTTVEVVQSQLARPTLKVSSPTAKPGGPVDYTITVKNISKVTVAVQRVELPIPAELQLVSVQGPGTDASSKTGGAFGSGTAVKASISIGPGAEINLDVKTTVRSKLELAKLPGAQFLNGRIVSAQGRVTSGGTAALTDDPDTAGGPDPTTFKLDAPADFSKSSKEGQPSSTPLNPGSTIKFKITAVNSEPYPVAVGVVDLLDERLDWVSGDPELSFDPGTRTVSAANLTVPPGARGLIFVARVRADAKPGSFSNSATLSPADGGTPVVVKTGSFVVVVGANFSTSTLEVENLSRTGAFEPGDKLRYTITLTNSGLEASGNVVVATGLLDPKLVDVVAASAGSYAAGRITWSKVSNVQPGQSMKLQFTARIAAGVKTGTTLTTTAAIQSKTGSVHLSRDLKVQASPLISVFTQTVSSSGGAAFEPGDTITYTIILKNTGKGAIGNALLTTAYDPLLTELTPLGGGVASGHTVTWKLGDILPGELTKPITVTAKLPATVAQGTRVESQLELRGDGLSDKTLSDDPTRPGKADPTVFVVTSAPKVAIVKSVRDLNGGEVQGGDELEFTLKVRNTGNSPAGSVVLTDPLDSHFEAISAPGGQVSGRSVTFRRASLRPSDGEVSFVIRASIQRSTADHTTITNRATSSFAQTPGSAQSNTVSVTVRNLPDFGGSTKQVSAATVQAGGKLSYTLVVTNRGNKDGTAVRVSDKLPGELAGVGEISDGGVFNPADRTLRWSLPSIARGQSHTLRFAATLRSPLDDGTRVCNQALIASLESSGPAGTSPPGGQAGPGGEPTCLVVRSAPKLVFTKTAAVFEGNQQVSTSVARPGQEILYTLRLRNEGNMVARELVLTDPFPARLEGVTALDGGSVVGGVARWKTRASLAPADGELVLHLRGVVRKGLDNGLKITNRAELAHKGLPAISSNEAVVTVVSDIDFTKSTKTVEDLNGGEVRPGDRLRYTITVRNTGDGTGKETLVSDPLDPRLTLEPATLDEGGGYDAASRRITWKLGSLAPGRSRSLHFVARVVSPIVQGAVIGNQALISAKGFASPVPSDADPATSVAEPTRVKVKAAARLGTSSWEVLDHDGGAIEPGDKLTLVLHLRNTGDAIATGLAVRGLFDARLLGAIVPHDGGKAGPGSVRWEVPKLVPGPLGEVQLRFTATVAEGLADGTHIVVQADLPGVVPGPRITLRVQARPDLSTSTLAVSDAAGWIGATGRTGPGHRLTFQIFVRNTGKAPAEALAVQLPVPAAYFEQAQALGGKVVGERAEFTLSAPLAPGGSATLLVTARVRAGVQDGTTMKPRAVLSAAGLPAPAILPGTALVFVVRPLLELHKSWRDTTGGSLYPGDTVDFVMTVVNVGNATAKGVQVRDELATSGVVASAIQSGGAISGTLVTWPVGDLPAGQSRKVQLRATVAETLGQGDPITNRAEARDSGGARVTSNTVTARLDYPELEVGLELAPVAPAQAPIEPGDALVVIVKVAARPGRSAADVGVVLPIDPKLFEVVDAAGGQWDAKAGSLSWGPGQVGALAKLSAGPPVTLRVRLKLRATARDGATARFAAIATEGETGLPWKSPPATIGISAKPELRLDKSITDLNGGKLRPLDKVRYELVVRVGAKAAAHKVVVTDPVPEGLEAIEVQAGGRLEAGVITWDAATTPALALVAPGQLVRLAFGARVSAEVGDGAVVSNQASASALGAEAPVLSDDPSTPAPRDPTARTVEVSSALAASTKVVVDENGPPLLPGELLRWRIRVLATSSQPLTGARLVDPVPAGTDYLPGSTTLNGRPVPDLAGASPLAAGLALASPGRGKGVLQPGAAGAAVVEFRTMVRVGTVAGTVIRNLATATATATAPALVGPAEIVVGQQASLHRTLKTVEVLDQNDNGAADPGEELRYTVTVHNDGGSAATGLRIDDPIPPGTAYVGGSMNLDGKALSDAEDADAGRYGQGAEGKPAIRVSLDSLPAGGAAVLRFRVRVLTGAEEIRNQAVARAKGLPPEPSDADGDEGNGNQPTIVVVAGKPSRLRVAKLVQDENGGEVEAGDRLRYTVTVRNHGAADAAGVRVVDELPGGLTGKVEQTVAPPGAKVEVQAAGRGRSTLVVSGLTVAGGDAVSVGFRVRVDPEGGDGEPICNVASAQGQGGVLGGQSDKACVTVGSTASAGTLRGHVFEDVGPADGRFEAGTDAVFGGWTVEVRGPARADGSPPEAVTARTDEKGAFVVDQVLPGERVVTVRSPGGAVFATRSFEQPAAGATRLDLPIAPTGRVYAARTARLVAGVRVFLYYDGTDPIAPGSLVAESELGEGQQGQRTDPSGAYFFASAPGRSYRIDLATGASGFAYPARSHRPEPGVARLNKQGFVVAEALPSLQAGLPRYVTRFSRLGKDAAGRSPPAPRHDHLPVDALTDAVKLTLTLSEKEATVGEVVHVTARVENRSALGLIADRLSGRGGVVLRNVLPPGLGYVPRSARARLQRAPDKPAKAVPLAPAGGPLMELRQYREVSGQTLGLDLPAGGVLLFRFQAVVLPTAELDHQVRDIARVFSEGGVPASEQASARLLIAGDPIFDRGTIVGRVFCDADGDGRFGSGEVGLPGARVYADNGHYADSDRYGRLHLMDVAPGNHLFKLDRDTLPPGSALTTDEKRVLYVSRGVGLSLSFGVRCAVTEVGPDKVERATVPAPTRKLPPDGPGVVRIEGDTDRLALRLDGRALPARRLVARIARGVRPVPLVGSATPVQLEPDAPIGLWTASAGRFDRYSVVARAVAKDGSPGSVVARRRFRGPPPATLAVRFAPRVLRPGRRYALVVRAGTRHGSSARSAPMPVRIHAPAPPLAAAAAPPVVSGSMWRLLPRARRAHLNGTDLLVSDDGRFAADFARPTDGRILIGLRAADGSRRDEYLSLPTTLPKARVAPPSAHEVIRGVPSAGRHPTGPPSTEPSAEPLPAKPSGSRAPARTRPPARSARPKPSVPPSKPSVPPSKPSVPPSKPSAPPSKPSVPPSKPSVPPSKPPAPPSKPAAKASAAPRPAPRLLGGGVIPGITSAVGPRAAVSGPAWRDVPVSFSPAEGLEIAGLKLLPLLRPTRLLGPSAVMPVAGGRILGFAALRVQGVPHDAVLAAVVLMDRSGRVVSRTPLSLPVPSSFRWDPNATRPTVPLGPGDYGLAFEVMVPAASERGGPAALVGWRTRARRLRLRASDPSLIPPGGPEKTVTASLLGADGRPTESLTSWLERKGAELSRRPARIAVVSVLSVAKDAKVRTERAAPRVRRVLIDAGMRPDRLVVVPAGAEVAWSDPSDRAMGQDRLEIRVRPATVSSSGARSPIFKMAAGLWIAGRPVSGNAEGRAPRTVRVRVGEPTVVELIQDDGGAVLWKRTFASRPGAPRAAPVPRAPASSSASSGAFGRAVLDELGAELARKPATAAKPTAAKPTAAKPTAAKPTAAKPTAVPLRVPRTGPVAAADLHVTLPREDATLGSTRLPVRGRTAPGNKLTVNGKQVAVDPDGRFFTTVELPVGRGRLELVSTDTAGNKATISRATRVRDRAVFLLALADTAAAQLGSHLQGMNDRTTYRARKLLLHGRGAVYLKGRIKGDLLGFSSLRFTAHLDTAKRGAGEDFDTNLFDPDRYYPVYGDGSDDVQDVKARGPLYVMVQADRSKLHIGNLRTAIQGQDLVRYDRAMYGAMIDYRRTFAKDFDTRLKVFAAPEDGAMSRRTDLLRGTGGSLYYLSGRDLLEGSERVFIVIRDRDSGVELGRIEQKRNQDYTIDYRQGRLLFKSPVASAVDSFFVAGGLQPGQHLSWNGHPAFVAVTYEARSQSAIGGTNAGVQVGEKMLGGRLEIGASYARESRDGSSATSYRLAGVHARLKLGKNSGLRAEYGYSESRDSLVAVSEDGGLTFGARPDEADHLGSRASGHALGIHLDADLADLASGLGFRARGTGLRHTARRFGHFKAHFQLVQAGFHTTSVLTEQGTRKFGFDTRLALGKRNTLAVRYDGVLSDGQQTYGGAGLASTWGTGSLMGNGSFAPYGRQLVTVQDSHRLGPVTLVGALAWNYAEDAQGRGRSAQTASLGGSFKVGERLSLRGAQLVTLGGVAANSRGALDHLITEVGADYKLLDNLGLTLRERVGWGGQNATMAGLRTQIGKASTLYLQQRLEDSYDTGRMASATVIGAESRYGKDQLSRAYGEYQLAGMGSGAANRAILGVGKRFVLAPGLHLDTSYERSQTFSGPIGETSRDALSLGGEWLRGRWFKLSSRQEVRIDQSDPAKGGARKLQVLSLNALSARITDAVTFFSRANYLRTENQTLNRLEAETLQTTTGLAFRPLRSDRLQIITKYTQLREKRPANIQTGLTEHSLTHIVSIEPIVELPFGLSWSHKLALRRVHEELGLADVPDLTSDLWLFISRLGYHLASRFDLAAEYRYLSTPLVGDNQHGALLEASYILARTLRIGAGYNFSRFEETSAGDIRRSEGGFFVRIVGMY